MNPDFATETRLIRERAAPSPHGEHGEALHLVSSFQFNSAADAADAFAKQGERFVYSRFSNPATDAFNRRVAAMEGAECALATASGMGAVLALCMGLTRNGGRVVSSAHVFGATVQLLSNFLRKFGVEVDFVASAKTDDWRKALSRKADIVLAETPSNPMLEILDLSALAQMSRKAGAVFAVDNCFCPWAQRPLEFGADVVVHSGTKYLDGQGRVLCGALAGTRELLMERIYPFLRSGGPAASPFNAWVAAKGMETLPLRYPAHCETATKLAKHLRGKPGVARVLYSGLPEHPGHELAMRQQNGFGGGDCFAVCRRRTRRGVALCGRDGVVFHHGELRRREVHDNPSGDDDAFAGSGGDAKAPGDFGRLGSLVGGVGKRRRLGRRPGPGTGGAESLTRSLREVVARLSGREKF